MLLLLVLLSVCSASPRSVTLTVMHNGKSSGASVSLTARHFEGQEQLLRGLLAGSLSDIDKNADVQLLASDLDRLVLGSGVDLRSTPDHWRMLLECAGGACLRVYLVPRGGHFVWPFVHYGHKVRLKLEALGEDSREVELTSISDQPRIFLVENLFDDVESHRIITGLESITDPERKMQRSTVGAERGKNAATSNIRTSSNAFDVDSEVSIEIQQRAFSLVRMAWDPDKADGLQVVSYEEGEAYAQHSDFFTADADPGFNFDVKNGGANRFATVFMYMKSPEEGGQTVFPLAKNPHPDYVRGGVVPKSDKIKANSWEEKLVHECYTKLAVAPRNATAVLFYNEDGQGNMDPLSEHAACPVLRGSKMGCNLWIWSSSRHGPIAPAAVSQENIQVRFHNSMDIPVEVWWKENSLATLLPGNTQMFNTFAQHRFHARVPGASQSFWEYTVFEQPEVPVNIVGDVAERDEL